MPPTRSSSPISNNGRSLDAAHRAGTCHHTLDGVSDLSSDAGRDCCELHDGAWFSSGDQIWEAEGQTDFTCDGTSGCTAEE